MRNLSNETLRLATFEFGKKNVIKMEKNIMEEVSTFRIMILALLKKLFGFKVTEVYPEINVYGFQPTNIDTSWNGLIGLLEKDDADFTSVLILTAPEKLDVMDFSPLVLRSTYSAITKTPSLVRGSGDIYWLDPFSEELWTLIFSISLLYMILEVSINKFWKTHCPVADQNVKTYYFWNNVSYVLGKGSSVISYVNSYHKLMVLCTHIIFWALLIVHGSVISSTISLTHSTKPLDTIDELYNAIKSDKYKAFTIKRGPPVTRALKNIKDTRIKAIIDNMIANGNTSHSINETVDYLLEETERQKSKNDIYQYMYIGIASFFHLDILKLNKSLKDFHVSEDPLQFISFAIGYSKNFTYSEDFNQAICWITSFGHVIHWEENENRRFTSLENLNSSTIPEVSPYIVLQEMNILFGSFYVTFISIMLFVTPLELYLGL